MINIDCTNTNNMCNSQYSNMCNNSCNIVTSPICNTCNLCGSNAENYLAVTNYGILVARVSGSYSFQGRTVNYSSGNFYLGQTYRLPFPAGSSNISINVFYLNKDFAWQQILQDFFPAPDRYCYAIIGTALAATCTPVPCS